MKRESPLHKISPPDVFSKISEILNNPKWLSLSSTPRLVQQSINQLNDETNSNFHELQRSDVDRNQRSPNLSEHNEGRDFGSDPENTHQFRMERTDCTREDNQFANDDHSTQIPNRNSLSYEQFNFQRRDEISIYKAEENDLLNNLASHLDHFGKYTVPARPTSPEISFSPSMNQQSPTNENGTNLPIEANRTLTRRKLHKTNYRLRKIDQVKSVFVALLTKGPFTEADKQTVSKNRDFFIRVLEAKFKNGSSLNPDTIYEVMTNSKNFGMKNEEVVKMFMRKGLNHLSRNFPQKRKMEKIYAHIIEVFQNRINEDEAKTIYNRLTHPNIKRLFSCEKFRTEFQIFWKDILNIEEIKEKINRKTDIWNDYLKNKTPLNEIISEQPKIPPGIAELTVYKRQFEDIIKRITGFDL